MKNLDLASKMPEETTAGTPVMELPVRAANEDTPTGGVLYRMIARRPSRRIPAAAAIASLFSLGAILAYAWGLYGFAGLASLSRTEIGALAAATLLPLTLIWLVAYVVWRGQEMHLMAEALARTAIRLTAPEETASAEIMTISKTVRRELDTMRAGLADALDQAARLNTLVSQELEDIERGTGRAELRTRHMEELLARHRLSLADLARTLGAESDTISRTLREQVEAVHGILGQAETRLETASARIAAQANALSLASEAARVGADASASMLDRQSSRLEVVAATALSRADELAERYEIQRQTIAEAAGRLEAEHQRLEAVFEAHREQMQAADAAMAGRAQEIGRTVSNLAARLDTTFESAAGRAAALRESISEEVRRTVEEVEEASGSVSRSTGAATRAIAATADELKSAAATLGKDVSRAATDAIGATAAEIKAATAAMTGEITRATSALTDGIGTRTSELRTLVATAASENDAAAERFNAAMIRLGGAAREAGRALHEAADELQTRMTSLPEDAARGAASLSHVLEEQVSALASIAEIVVRHARVLDRTSPRHEASLMAHEAPAPARHDAPGGISSPMSPLAGPSRLTPPRPEPARAEAGRRWGISDLLAAAGRSHDASFAPPAEDAIAEREFHRTSLQLIETLQALAIDLDRALEQSPPAELWQRYQAGERNVFARRLYNMAGRQLYDRIAVKYRAEEEFRDHVDRFVSLFERLLAAAAARDRDNILVETYLGSDTGKVYLMLAQASGKFA